MRPHWLDEAIFAVKLWRANGRSAVGRWWAERNANHVQVLSRNPPVVQVWWGRDDYALQAELRAQPLILLYVFNWCAKVGDIPGLVAETKRRHGRFPRHRQVFLCNEAFMVEPLRAAGLEAIFCHHNAWVSEDVFRPMAGVAKEIDAVYNAALSPYKRHELAAQVRSLMLLTYSRSGAKPTAYEAEVRQLLAHATWPQGLGHPVPKLSPMEIAAQLNRAHVGVILSEFEGGNFASMEYLLCGLPVVSTPSVGGRDVFWDERYVTICEPEPAKVAAAVQELKARRLDPQFVRAATLEKVRQHRGRLRDLLAPVGAGDFACPWPSGSHGPHSFLNLRQVGQALRR